MTGKGTEEATERISTVCSKQLSGSKLSQSKEIPAAQEEEQKEQRSQMSNLSKNHFFRVNSENKFNMSWQTFRDQTAIRR